ncbi:unnamed protein product [Symbiodinium natans]|uniref:Uncharacterized protein n=1 Tax=Symbiodinium natans TaxID=878477 RepID=A0A812MD42_9DINO|nr:unnamed protein product [Symbiodinium natans]
MVPRTRNWEWQVCSNHDISTCEMPSGRAIARFYFGSLSIVVLGAFLLTPGGRKSFRKADISGLEVENGGLVGLGASSSGIPLRTHCCLTRQQLGRWLRQVQGLGFRVYGLGFWVLGFGFWV